MKNPSLLSRLIALVIFLSVSLGACAQAPSATPATAPAAAPATVAPATAPAAAAATVAPTVQTGAAQNAGTKDLILATTTSTQDSGLLDELIPAFEKSSGYKVKIVAVGSGQALKMGEQGNADVLLVHSPAAEKTYMTNGFGAERKLVMHNDFVIVGPQDDPAGIKGMTGAVDAFKKIEASNAAFISRGDNSGTHVMELSLWKSASVDPKGASWRSETGQGMGPTLKIASEKKAYTLTDRATYLANAKSLDLKVLVEGDKILLNVYHVITVNAQKWPKVNQEGGKAFMDYLVSAEGQDLIAKYGVQKFGQALFTPDASKTDADLGLK